MNDTSVQERKACWVEKTKKLRASLHPGTGNSVQQSIEEGSQPSLKRG